MDTQTTNKNQQVLTVAQSLFHQNPDWVTFFREVLGVEGAVRTAFPTLDELNEFEKSEEFASIQRMLVKLREKKTGTAEGESDSEPTRVITVRLPQSMHDYLRTEAHDMHTSMNKLCISKLLQVIEQDMIPSEKTSSKNRRSASRPAQPQPQAQQTPSQVQPYQPAAPVSHAPSPANRFNSHVTTLPLKTSF
jgi:predicted HicB family RNase H-like nuclease